MSSVLSTEQSRVEEINNIRGDKKSSEGFSTLLGIPEEAKEALRKFHIRSVEGK
jgi:hypothetical protein